MFKLNRIKSTDRPGERFEFRFSSFRALQVPRGWDRLCICIVAAENGRAIAKSTKATNRNGICQWPDTMLEPIWVPQNDVTKEPEECNVKFILTTGSAKTGILGESTLNLTDYLSSADHTSLSLTLNKCSYGTILQVKIQCLSAKPQSPSSRDELSTNSDEFDSKSDGSDSTLNRGARSLHEATYSAPGSQRTSNSGENLVSPKINTIGGLSMGRQDRAASFGSTYSADGGDDLIHSNNSSFRSRASGSSLQHGNAQAVINGLAQLSAGASNSSKDLEAAEETIEELRDEAKMWERHSRKLKVDLEMLKKECSDKAKQCEELENELSSAHAECTSAKQEIEKLKASLEESTLGQTEALYPGREGAASMHQKLEDEVKLRKESNLDLTMQLKKYQEANAELVAMVQELEETIEAQKCEISKFSQDNDVSIAQNADSAASCKNCLDMEKEIEELRAKIEDLEKDCAELTEENLVLIYKLKDGGDVVREGRNSNDLVNCGNITTLSVRIHELEQELRDMELLQNSGDKINNLDLETKCANLEVELANYKSEVSNLERKLQESLDELEEKNQELDELKHQIESFNDFELGNSNLDGVRDSGYSDTVDPEELEIEAEADEVIATIQLKEQEIDELKHSKLEIENLLSEFRKEKSRLEERLVAARKESTDNSKSLDGAQNDLVAMSSSTELNASANKTLEPKSEELQKCKLELEMHISELEEENVQLSERIYGMEAQLLSVIDDNESSLIKLENSLKVSYGRKEVEMETQKLAMKRKLVEAQIRFSEALEESEFLKLSTYKLQGTVQNLIEENDSLQAQNDELERQKLELLDQMAHLEVELEESQKKSFDFCEKIDCLEEKIMSLQKDISLKEQSLLLELENIIQEHKEHEMKINRAHVLLNKIESDKSAEVENLEKEIASLSEQMSSSQDEREKATVDAIHEVSVLRGDNSKLESNLRDVKAQLSLYETQLETLRLDSNNKVRELVDLLNASKQTEEMLIRDAELMKSSLEKQRRSTSQEKQQMKDEISELKTRIEKTTSVQVENSGLQSSLDEVKIEKGKLEELLRAGNKEREELKAEVTALKVKLSRLQEPVHLVENERCNDATSKNLLSEGCKELSFDQEGILINDESDLQSKMSLLESKLAQALHDNQMCEVKLKRYSQTHVGSSEELKKDGLNDNVNNTDRISALETELKDMKERLLNMSLQYAEVEAQREELVMKLKATNPRKDKKWFA